jgi:hypothetical protein
MSSCGQKGTQYLLEFSNDRAAEAQVLLGRLFERKGLYSQPKEGSVHVHNIMMLGAGDLGVRIADALLHRGHVSELTLVDLPNGGGAKSAEAMASCISTPIYFDGINALNSNEVEDVLRRRKPDVIVFGAALRNPNAVRISKDPKAQTLWSAGMGVQLAYQVPILLSVMKAVKEVSPDTPLINATVPDICHALLHAGGLAPTAGFGNNGIIQMRVEANLFREQLRAGDRNVANVPRVRVIGGFAHVIDVMFGQNPGDVKKEPLVFLGEEGTRAGGDAVYAGEDLANSITNPNMPTALSAMPVIEALLPGGADTYTSMPGPLGMLGGYPVKISNQKIELDLPPSITLEEAVKFNQLSNPIIGVERIDTDGTVYYTEAAQRTMADLEPRLTEPYNALTDGDRTKILLDLMNSFK